MRRRVKITGIGPVTPAGIGREAFFRGINDPVSRVRLLSQLDQTAGPFIGAEILDFDLKNYAPELDPRRLARHTQFGLAAAILATADAGLTPAEANELNPVVVTGTSLMDFDRISREIHIVQKKGPRYAMARNLYETSLVKIPGTISEFIGPAARMFSLQSSCCSGLDAVGQAAELVATGQSNLAITGGTECPLTYHPMVEFNAAELSPVGLENPEKACRPFDLWRSTGVIGEGAAMLILEPEDSPRPAYAWITGYGYANDANGLAGEGIGEAARIALANAGRRPDEVDYICAWGPGHRVIDNNEATAMRRVFQDKLPEIPVTSIKGMIGTALAASGPIQAASTALSLRHSLLPPTVNWETPDPHCPLNLSSRPRYLGANVAIVNAHGMAGSNAVIVIERLCPR
ncbi:3-oxoacyl-[acyl-carrier-protein] synthase 2 [Lacunisphaera limnophila]|uniref:3-oxoacyl-[acyl-carrier-protein] synthase 2 n=1 Tax=Lacunisphaera limnophila TaxID=1838286 RepID=A0A1D8AVC6_9BACT|nr:beta-ketoacyl synthase N-terminal-like domain-containing protein [Lacunisphaera limnophila]AOS44843.1 3-oxoacyl-[acyl-carrier-protein] synthase 2 [Lacunisphaera limnophila]